MEGIVTSGPTPESTFVVVNGSECATARVCSETTGCSSARRGLDRCDAHRRCRRGARGNFVPRRRPERSGTNSSTVAGRNATPASSDKAGASTGTVGFGRCVRTVCVEAPECVVNADCLDPQAPSCIVASCVKNERNSISRLRVPDEREMRRRPGLHRRLLRPYPGVHPHRIELRVRVHGSHATDLGSPARDRCEKDGCVRVRDGYPFWWGAQRRMALQTNGSGTYPYLHLVERLRRLDR